MILGTRKRLLFQLWIAVLLLAGGVAAQPPDHSGALHDRVAEVAAEAESLRKLGQGDSSFVLIDNTLSTARQNGDAYHTAELLVVRGRLLVSLGRGKEAETDLLEAITDAESLQDTTLLCESLLQLCFAVDAQGRPPRAVAIYERLVAVAEAAGDEVYAAQAHLMLGRRDLRAGHFNKARDYLEGALSVFQRHDKDISEMNALHLLGLLHASEGDLDEARAYWLRSQALAQKQDNKMMAAGALNNLGVCEHRIGDPSIAIRYWDKARELYLSVGRMRAAINPGRNAAEIMVVLGRYDEAETLFVNLRKTAEEQNYTDLVARLTNGLGSVAMERRQYNLAARHYRQSLALLGDSESPNDIFLAFQGLVLAMAEMDSVAAALAIVEQQRVAIRDRLKKIEQVSFDLLHADLLMKSDRWDEAIVLLESAESQAAGMELSRKRIVALPMLARSYSMVGRPGDAYNTLQTATAIWEEERKVPFDHEWREVRGARGVWIYTDLAGLILEAGGADHAAAIEEAFNLVQRFKARTLLERMAGPGRDVFGAEDVQTIATLKVLQSEVLGKDELLLEFALGPHRSFLFSVTAGQIRVTQLPGTDELGPILTRYQRVVSAAPNSSGSGKQTALAATRVIGENLSRLLLAEITDLLEENSTLLLVPDGQLNSIPFATLSLPASEGGTRGSLLGEVAITRYPSSTVLSQIRDREQATLQGETLRMLAVTGSMTADGQRLPGADREARMLVGWFENVDLFEKDSAGENPLTEEGLQAYDVIHIASHTSIDDQNPWLSGIQLAGYEDFSRRGTGEIGTAPSSEFVLRASEVVNYQLRAEMVVLSACESAGGRVLGGEGVIGITSAFLSSGVPTVLATLWPVDDVATEEFMSRFYGHLAGGETIAQALRSAQIDFQGLDSRAHPFYWAGFVLVGDGQGSIPLQKKSDLTPYLIPSAIVALTLLLYRAWAGGRRVQTKEPRAGV